MVHISFSELEKKQLSYERYHHPHQRIRQKTEALWLKSQELPHKDICTLCQIKSTTLTRYLKEYKLGGIKAFLKTHFNKPQSSLEPYHDLLYYYFKANPMGTGKEMKAKIEELTGVNIGVKAVESYLHTLGFSPRKIGMVPAKADSKKQEVFKKKSWNLG